MRPRSPEDLGALLRDFGPPNTTRPEYPFWHLQSDGLWVIPEREALQADLDAAPHRHNPRLTVIRAADAHGGLPEDLGRELRARPELVVLVRVVSGLRPARRPAGQTRAPGRRVRTWTTCTTVEAAGPT